MSTARHRGMTLDEIIAKLQKYYSTHDGLIHDQMQRLSSVEKQQFNKNYQFLSVLQKLIVVLRDNRDGLSEFESRRYAFEALLLLTPSVEKKEISFEKRLDRYQCFLRKQNLGTVGKYLLDISFKLASAVLALTGVGVLFYLYLKDSVNKITEGRSSAAILNNSSSLFKQHARNIYKPTPGVIPKLA